MDWSRVPRLEREPEVDPAWVVRERGVRTWEEVVAEKTGETMRAVNRMITNEKTVRR